MIRINLLRKERKKVKRPKIAAAEPSQTTKQLGFVAIIIMAVAICGYLWFDITGQKDAVQKQVADAQRKLNKLVKVDKVKSKAEMLERQKNNLNAHLEALTKLKDSQRSPLYPLAHLFYALQENPDVSFTELREQQSGEQRISFLIKGEATGDALQRFMETLRSFAITVSIEVPRVDQVRRTFDLPVAFKSQQELMKGTPEEPKEGR
jgi:paraquat-inducible protein B